ncbi:MAG: hypothetical protein DYH04_07370 [Nitrospira sp. NTP2]|nr:hypothetical protein [Nitrospira sp. NTP2]RIK60691.1 MAG: hypothetical protein DCC63_03415 [Nitrospira sp.]
MKIRKKAPKPALTKPPLYLIGYRGTAPPIEELKAWYDLHYGGPLLGQEGSGSPTLVVRHGPWQAHIATKLPEANAAEWHRLLAWGHQALGTVAPTAVGPGIIVDTILLTARLARGLTLLTQGTAFDLTCHDYLNPSDWQDRPLNMFMIQDHVSIRHQETEDGAADWFYTLGLTKFGLDELELIQPRGLPERETIELLLSAVDEVQRGGHNPKVGQNLDLPDLAQTVRIVKHRTAAPTGQMRAFRQIADVSIEG